MSRKIKINGQLVDFSTLVSTNADYKNKKWRYKQDGTMEVVTNETENDDDIIFSGSKSSLRRIADIERNVSILSTKLLTSDTSANFEDGVDNLFGTLFTDDVRFKGNVRIDHTPTIASDAATKGYVDTAVSNVSVDLTGYATETYVDTAVANLVDSAPTTLDTLNELAAALGDDADFATTVTNSLANKADTSAIPTDVADLTDNSSLLGGGFSGSYNDLTDTPTIPADVSDLTDTTNLLTHFSGSYDDLADVPFELDGVEKVSFQSTEPNSPAQGSIWFNPSTGKWNKAIINPVVATVQAAAVASVTGTRAKTLTVNPAEWSVPSDSAYRYVTVTFATPLWLTEWIGVPGLIGLNTVSMESGVSYNSSALYNGTTPDSYTVDYGGVSDYTGGRFTEGRITAVTLQVKANTGDRNVYMYASDGIIFDEIDPGYTTLASITGSDLDMGTNKILYSNVYSAIEDLPSASSYHGMFAHVHGTGKAYYAHAGSWVELANVSELPSLTGYATETFVNTAISNLVNGADAAFDTLKEIADAMATDTELSTAISNLTIPSTLTDLSITDGTAGQVLTTDGAGGFTFADASGGASVEVSGTAPSSPETGDLWFDSDNTGELYVYNGSAWITTSSGDSGIDVNMSTTSPTTATAGQLWYSTETGVLYIYDGTFWISTDSPGTGGGSSTPSSGGASLELSDTAPSSPTDGALWFKTDTLDLYVYYSSSWVEVGGVGGGSTSPSWEVTNTTETLVASDKKLVDTSSAAITVTLPATPSVGDEVRIIDAAGNAATNNITVARNGSNIMGLAEDFVININEAAFGLVYFNATRGWVLTEK